MLARFVKPLAFNPAGLRTTTTATKLSYQARSLATVDTGRLPRSRATPISHDRATLQIRV